MSNPPHSIIFDYQTFSIQEYGGISRYFCELAARIDESSDFRAKVLAPFHFNRHLKESSISRCGIHLPFDDLKWRRLCRAGNRILTPLLTRVADPSLIHRTFFKPLPKPKKIPLVLTVFDMIHELFQDQFQADDRVSNEKRAAVAQADHVLCISESTALDLVRIFGVDPKKISITYLGYSPIFAENNELPTAIRSGNPYILYVGQRDGYKNFELFVRAYAASSRLSRAFDLVLFGGPGISESERELMSELNISADRVVHLTGGDKQLSQAYRGARLFVYPSRYEGFGIPPLEAMAAGCPVACSNSSSIPEVVGNAARLFNPSDVDDIRDALEEVSFDDALHAKLTAEGANRASQFTWNRCATDTMKAYSRLLS